MDVSMFQPLQQLGILLLENAGFFIRLILLMLLVALVHTFWLTSHQFPLGPWPWPIVGNLLILGKAPHIKLPNLAKQDGPLTYIRLGSVNALVASSLAMANEFL
jgi:hypothetical protein